MPKPQVCRIIVAEPGHSRRSLHIKLARTAEELLPKLREWEIQFGTRNTVLRNIDAIHNGLDCYYDQQDDTGSTLADQACDGFRELFVGVYKADCINRRSTHIYVTKWQDVVEVLLCNCLANSAGILWERFCEDTAHLTKNMPGPECLRTRLKHAKMSFDSVQQQHAVNSGWHSGHGHGLWVIRVVNPMAGDICMDVYDPTWLCDVRKVEA
jgi:hypothetical protein